MAPVIRKSARIAALSDINEWNDGHNERRPIAIDEPSTALQKVNTASKQPSRRRTPKPKPYDTPPTYTIDLSLPAAERYVKVALDFKEKLLDLIQLFDEVVESLQINISLKTVHRLAKLFLRRVHSGEQTEELRGISKAIGIEMYLLVCFNTLLDLFMGCTSGGVRAEDEDGRRMLHFRTLDWGMDVLRKVVVQYEYVNKPYGEVIARSITYVGFVGILTGVRPDLSISLNFRGHHNNSSSKWANLRYYGNHLAVLLSFRPSIASRLRAYILPIQKRWWSRSQPLPNLAEITSSLPSTISTACYIIASDGDTTTIFEKDRATAEIRSSNSFITATNHDVAFEFNPSNSIHHSKMFDTVGMQDLIDESINRKECMESNWRRAVAQHVAENGLASEEDTCVIAEDIQRWMVSYPIANECTHYAVIMDPKKGQVVWCRRWRESLIL